MSFRDDILADIESIRTITGPTDFDIRTSQLTIRQRTWIGGRPGSADAIAPHLYPSTAILSSPTVASDLPTSLARLVIAFAGYSAHIVAIRPHAVSDTVNTITAPPPVDLGTGIVAANQLKAQYNLHIASSNFHWNADTTNSIVTANATDLASLILLVNSEFNALSAHIAFDAVTDVDLVLPRHYRIRQVSSQEIASTGGRYEAGDLIVEHITPSDGMGNGFTPLQLKPRPATNATEVIYLITSSLDTDGIDGEYSLRELRSWRPFTFDLVLKRTERTP